MSLLIDNPYLSYVKYVNSVTLFYVYDKENIRIGAGAKTMYPKFKYNVPLLVYVIL